MEGYKVLEFKAIKKNDSLTSFPGFSEATWKDVDANFNLVKKSIRSLTWGIIKVENGSVDGSGYDHRHRRNDNRSLGDRLIVKRQYGTNNPVQSTKNNKVVIENPKMSPQPHQQIKTDVQSTPKKPMKAIPENEFDLKIDEITVPKKAIQTMSEKDLDLIIDQIT